MQKLEAWCSSVKCAGIADISRVQKNVRLSVSSCPDCGHVLEWRKPGVPRHFARRNPQMKKTGSVPMGDLK